MSCTRPCARLLPFPFSTRFANAFSVSKAEPRVLAPCCRSALRRLTSICRRADYRSAPCTKWPVAAMARSTVRRPPCSPPESRLDRRRCCIGEHQAMRGLWLPTCAALQVGSYLGYTGHDAGVVSTAARDPSLPSTVHRSNRDNVDLCGRGAIFFPQPPDIFLPAKCKFNRIRLLLPSRRRRHRPLVAFRSMGHTIAPATVADHPYVRRRTCEWGAARKRRT